MTGNLVNRSATESTGAALFSLLLGGLTIGMTEFLIMGVLPDVARDVQISIPSAGHLISIYALGVVIGAPLIVGLTTHLPPKRVLMMLMLINGLFNGLFALAPNQGLLLFTRFLAGLPHGAFFGIGAVVASRLAARGREARAVSMMFAGLTVANIIGVPIGTYIGHNFSWRYSFGLIFAVAMMTLFAIELWLPTMEASADVKFVQSLKIFKKPGLWLIIGIASIGTGGLFAWISYIAPLMTEVAHFQSNAMTWIMIVAGLGMAFGNILGGRLADQFSPLRTTGGLFVAMAISLLLNSILSQYQVAAVALTFITGAIGFAAIAPMQMLIIEEARESEMLASAVLQASCNMGNALGAFLGGLPLIAGFGYTSPQYVGMGLALCGVGFCFVLNGLHLAKKTQSAIHASKGV